jgi:hypothetical protein
MIPALHTTLRVTCRARPDHRGQFLRVGGADRGAQGHAVCTHPRRFGVRVGAHGCRLGRRRVRCQAIFRECVSTSFLGHNLTNFAAIRLPAQPLQDEVRPAALPPQQCAPPDHSRSIIDISTVYADGNVCISILHTPGDDPMQYEHASERWSPVQSVEKVLLSVISMLAGTLSPTFISGQLTSPPHSEPNLESGANIDCCKLYRDDRPVRESACLARDLADRSRTCRSMSGGCASRSGSSLGCRSYGRALSRTYECRYHFQTRSMQCAGLSTLPGLVRGPPAALVVAPSPRRRARTFHACQVQRPRCCSCIPRAAAEPRYTRALAPFGTTSLTVCSIWLVSPS